MQRYFVNRDQFEQDAVTITGDDAHHLIRVMRARAGDRLICGNGQDREVEAEISEIGKNEVRAMIVRELPMNAEPQVAVWIAQSLPKGDKMDAVIQKCTEIGATRFVPFFSQRTVVQYDRKQEAKRLERWQKIAKEAAEQAHRNRIPGVETPLSWKRMLETAGKADAALLCYEKESTRLIGERLRELPELSGTIMLIVGPEGGFSEKESSEAEAAGCVPVGLGKRILRTETAAMVGLTCILYESGEMGG